MASVRKLKSKGRAGTSLSLALSTDLRPVPGAAWQRDFSNHDASLGADPAYRLRKQAFTSLPPAKCVRPMRHVKAWAQRAAQDLQDKRMAILRTEPGAEFNVIEQACTQERSVLLGRLQVLGMARAWAKAGNGWGVQRVAERVTSRH